VARNVFIAIQCKNRNSFTLAVDKHRPNDTHFLTWMVVHLYAIDIVKNVWLLSVVPMIQYFSGLVDKQGVASSIRIVSKRKILGCRKILLNPR